MLILGLPRPGLSRDTASAFTIEELTHFLRQPNVEEFLNHPTFSPAGPCYDGGVLPAETPNSEPDGFARPGPLRERLSGLVLAGRKTAAFDLYDRARFDPEGVTEVGRRWTMHDSGGRPLAVLLTTHAEIVHMVDVTWPMVELEAESFRDVAHWRTAHEEFWAGTLDEVRSRTGNPSWSIDDDTLLVFERFAIVERLTAADEGRYPVVELNVPADQVDLAAADLYDLDTVGIEELGDDGSGSMRLRAGFASDDAAVEAEAALWSSHPEWSPRFEVIVGDDWLDAWREHFEPVRVGRLVVVPDWDGAASTDISANAPDNAIELRLDPKRAWGTGAHSSTRLALANLQAGEIDLDGASVIDVGCGSGVLAIASLLLGAASAYGIDVDRTAIPVTMENARRNGVGDRCTAAFEPLAECMHTYDVVLANILAPVLIELADDLQRVAKPGGTIVLAGLIDEQRERVTAAFERSELLATTSDGSWCSLVLRRNSAD